MIQQQLEKAAQEARIATAMTLTPRGTHSSIDDIPFVEKQITFDEVAESAFVKGGDYDEGLTSEYFCEAIDQYIYDNHYDNEKDDIVKEWQGLSYIESTRKILNELNQEDNERDKAVNASTPYDATCNRL